MVSFDVDPLSTAMPIAATATFQLTGSLTPMVLPPPTSRERFDVTIQVPVRLWSEGGTRWLEMAELRQYLNMTGGDELVAQFSSAATLAVSDRAPVRKYCR